MTKKLQTILPVFCLRMSDSVARFEQISASSPSPLGGTSRALCGSGSRTDQQFHRALVGCDRGKMICFTVRWSFSCGLTGTGGQAALRRAHVRTATRARSPRPHCSPDSEERRSWPLQWLSSISEELSGVSLQPLPGRSTAAHAAKQYAVVAFSAEQLLCRAARWGPFVKCDANKRHAWDRRLVVVVVSDATMEEPRLRGNVCRVTRSTIPGDSSKLKPSTTNNCWPSRAPKIALKRGKSTC